MMLTGRDKAAVAETAAAIAKLGRKAVIEISDLRGRGRGDAVAAATSATSAGSNSRQQCRRDQARRLPRIDRRGLEGRLRAEVLRPMRLARAAWAMLGRSTVRSSTSPASAAASPRRSSASVRRSTPPWWPGPRRWPTSARRRACRSTPSIRPGRDRPAMEAHHRRDEEHRPGRGQRPRRIPGRARHHAVRHREGCRRPDRLHGVAAGRWLHGTAIGSTGANPGEIAKSASPSLDD